MIPLPRPPASKRAASNRGQALVLGLFFVFAVAAVLLLMYNTGRTADEKLRITNAADAAAWSVATLEARALNYDAYANRAIVANQVAIAQAVSLISWMHYFETAVEYAPALDTVASSWLFNPAEYPRLLLLLAGVHGTQFLDLGSGGSLRAIVEGLDKTLGAIVTAHDAASSALSTSQRLMHASLVTGAGQAAFANDLVDRIDPDMRASINPLSHDFPAFTRALAKDDAQGDARGRLADVVLRSRDAFTRSRVWSIRGPDLPPLQRKVELKRRGGTELLGFDEWRALDTLEHQGKRLKRWRWRWRRAPLAWGGASATSDGSPGAERGEHGGSYASNPITSLYLAEPSIVRIGQFGGLPETRELRDLSANADHTAGVTVHVAKPRRTLRTSGGTGSIQPQGRLRRFEASSPGDLVAAMGRGEVFFERPGPRSDGRAERPSLYSPYWQARLAASTPADRAWAATLQDGVVLP